MHRIAIHSVPRSGSSWLGELFNSSPAVKYKYQPLFSYALKGFIHESSGKEEIDAFFKKLIITEDAFLDQTENVESGKFPRFQKNEIEFIVYKEVRYHHILKNLLEKDQEVKVVGLVRNPYAVLNSWFKASREFRRDLDWKEEEEWLSAPKKNQGKVEEFYGFEKWMEVTLLFEELKTKYPDRFYLIDYTALLRNTDSEVRSMFAFCGIPFEKQTEDFIKASREKNNPDTYSVFKQRIVDSDWQKELDPSIKNAVDGMLYSNTILRKYL